MNVCHYVQQEEQQLQLQYLCHGQEQHQLAVVAMKRAAAGHYYLEHAHASAAATLVLCLFSILLLRNFGLFC
jgi:hypothetical protein